VGEKMQMLMEDLFSIEFVTDLQNGVMIGLLQDNERNLQVTNSGTDDNVV